MPHTLTRQFAYLFCPSSLLSSKKKLKLPTDFFPSIDHITEIKLELGYLMKLFFFLF